MLEIYNKVRSVPEDAKKTIGGGKLKGMTDINPMWRIKTLTDVFGVCGFGWYYNVKDKWIEECGSETCAFVDIELFVKMDGEWSMPIHGTGGSKLIALEKGSPAASDECFKMATTDALSVACKQLGMGADVYWDKDRTKYSTQEDNMQALPIMNETKKAAKQSVPATPEPDKKAEEAQGYPDRDKMLEFAKKRYPEGSDPLNQLLKCWKIESLEQASTAQLMVVWGKYNKGE